MPGGALAIPFANRLIEPINLLMPLFSYVVATQDFHPQNHASFKDLWPVHCVAGSYGAELVAGLDRSRIQKIFRKGEDPLIDSYSAFFDNEHSKQTGLAQDLRAHGVNSLYLVGVATEYCVLYSALDALDLGFEVNLITDACCGLDDQAVEKAYEMLVARRGHLVTKELQ